MLLHTLIEPNQKLHAWVFKTMMCSLGKAGCACTCPDCHGKRSPTDFHMARFTGAMTICRNLVTLGRLG